MYKRLQSIADRALEKLVPSVSAAAYAPGCYPAGNCPARQCTKGCTIGMNGQISTCYK
ncbi:hypothetical protein ABT104_20120 [Streptomyces mobaraensis]|uniref:hypothetical protein n=1 Tax=Streptomyces mobaraensis TaxID=35621 RepID=UPI0033291F38